MNHTPLASIIQIESSSSKASGASALCRNISHFVLALLAWCVIASSASAQNIQFTQGSVGSGLDAALQIPLRAYPGRGQASLPITLYYSSKVWRMTHLSTLNVSGTYQSIAEAFYAEFSTAGWQTSLDIPKIEWPKQTDAYFYSGGPYNFVNPSGSPFRVRRVYIHMPDGSTHELRKDDQPYSGTTIDMSGTFYAVDGSRLRYDSTGQNTGTLYLPDGTRYVLSGGTAQFIDRNGNTLNYNATTREWTDTLGRVIGMPLPANPQAQTQPYSYTVPGVDGPVTYQFRWQHLSDGGVLTPGSNNQTPTRKPIANNYLPQPEQSPSMSNYPVIVQSTYSERPSLFITDGPDDGGSAIVVGRSKNGGQVGGEAFDPVVLTEIILPNGLSYKFTYNIYGEIDKVVYPTGGFERYEYGEMPYSEIIAPPYSQANRAVTKRQLSADGSGNDLATWQYSVASLNQDMSVPLDTLRVTTTAPDLTRTEVYKYNLRPPIHGRNNSPFWSFGFEDARQGMVYDERVYAPNLDGSKGPMLRRKLTEWERTTNTVTPRLGGISGDNIETAYRNPRAKKEISIILDTGGDALAKTLTYQYNTSNQLTTGLDLTLSTESFFDNVAQETAQTGTITAISPVGSTGTLASSAETAYVDSSDPNYSSYQSRHILGLVKSVVLKDSNGQVVSKTETLYDEANYSVNISGDTTIHPAGGADIFTWIDPGTPYRGNATTSRQYVTINPDTYLESHVSYDQWGNPRGASDARGNESRVEYSSEYNYAFPTQTTSADPDGNGPKTALTTITVYDTSTGLVTSTTDANGQVTTLSYKDSQNATDPLNRLRKVTRPDGSFTTYDYHDSTTDIEQNGMYVETKSTLDTGRTMTSRQYFDRLGRGVRAFVFENTDVAAPWLGTDTHYDPLMGRASQVSNPYRTATPSAALPSSCSVCTTSTYDALGRVKLVTLPDATTVQTNYQGIYTTVTDQAGKQRRQKVNALGQIVRVDEPDASGNLGSVTAPLQPTFYQYDTRGAMIQIAQGLTQPGSNPEDANNYLQHRYFKYDSLGRLTYERQVEQVANPNFIYTDPLTGNSQWTRKLVYDETLDSVSYKGLLTSMTDARNIRTEYRYDNLNRSARVSYNDNVTPAVNYFYDEARYTYTGEDRTIYNKGRLTEVQTESLGSVPATSQAYNYDLMGRVANNRQTVGANSYTMLYRYYPGGVLKSEQYPSGRVVSYAYDDAARLSGVTSGATNYGSNYQYGPKGLLTSVTLGNGAIESYDYNGRLQLASLSLTKNSNTIQRYDYKYGVAQADGTVDETKNNGQIGRIESFVGTQKQWQQRFSYDSLGRLSQSSEYRGDNSQLSYLINYDYDAFGNRYQHQASNPANTNPLPYIAVEDADINKSTNRFTFSQVTYDNAGNLLSDSKFTGQQYQYDANNRQRQVVTLTTNSKGTPVVPATTSVYDGTGQRVAQMTAGNIDQIFVYDAPGKLVAEYGQAPIYMNYILAETNGGTKYVLTDQQGSTRLVIDDQGVLVARHDYQPFGGEIYGVGMRVNQGYGAGDGVRQKYAGMEMDEGSGLDHTLWRKYDSSSGRWTSPDPYGGSMSISSPQSFNRYAYVNNDPVNKVDPTGLLLSDIGVLQTDDPEEAQIAEHQSLRDLQLSVNKEAGDRWEKLTGIHSGAGFGEEVTASAEVVGVDGSQQTVEEKSYSSNSTMVTIWEFVQGINPLNLLTSFGHVSYITMQNDTSWSWPVGPQNLSEWRHNSPSSDFTNERKQGSIGRGHILDFGLGLNKKFQNALIHAYDKDGGTSKHIYTFWNENCGKAFNVAINAIRGDLNKQFHLNLPESTGIRPSVIERYIIDNLQRFDKGGVIFRGR